MFRNLKDRWQMWMDRVTEKFRKRVAEPRLWRMVNGELIEEVCEHDIARVLVAVGIAASRSEADRLLKSRSVQWRPWDLHDDWRPVELRAVLPAGEPMMLRRGKQCYGVVTAMVPHQDQSLRFWNLMLTNQIS